MNDVRMIYSKERGTWNVFIGAEWYYESKDYEQAEKVFESFFWPEDDDYEEEAW